MSKYLILSILLLGCSPKFKSGDCLTLQGYNESWSKPDTIMEILEVGKEHYYTRINSEMVFNSKTIHYKGSPISYEFEYIENIATKINCPGWLK